MSAGRGATPFAALQVRAPKVLSLKLNEVNVPYSCHSSLFLPTPCYTTRSYPNVINLDVAHILTLLAEYSHARRSPL